MAEHRRRIWPIVLGVFVLAIAALVAVWDWDWFRPLVEARASAALGRKVTMSHLGLRLGWHPVVTADNVTVANPDGFPEAPYFAHIQKLSLAADARAYLHNRQIVLLRIDVQQPDVNAIQHPDGHATWDLPALASGNKSSSSNGPATKIGDLIIAGGQAHVVDPKVHADFALKVNTQEPEGGKPGQIVVNADGTYAKAKITGQAVGGTLLSLRDAATPYPIDAHFENGATKVALNGTLQDPLHFAGTNLKLRLSGQDMSQLYALTGIPIPQTPPYDITGQLAYADRKIQFTGFRGRLGSSDFGGNVAVDPTTPNRPTINAELVSRRIDLADLGGFIGSQPGRANTPGQTPEQKRAVQRAVASPQFLPTATISLPKLNATDVHLTYRADHVQGRSVPFDTFATKLDIVDGRIAVHPLTVGVGQGSIVGNIDLQPAQGAEFHTKADVTFERVDVGRLLAATHLVRGSGLLGGQADLDSTGNSMATLIGRGNGQIKLLLSGGNVSALIVDLAGLELGNALLSAIGLPNRAQLQCLAVDMALRKGVLETRTFLIDTSEADVIGSGSINLATERLDFQERTLSRHMSVGSLPTPIRITGTLKNPSIAPAAGPLAARAGAAVALGVLLTPLGALLPTVQFGTGKENLNRCQTDVHQDERTLPAAAVPQSAAAKSAAAKSALPRQEQTRR